MTLLTTPPPLARMNNQGIYSAGQKLVNPINFL